MKRTRAPSNWRRMGGLIMYVLCFFSSLFPFLLVLLFSSPPVRSCAAVFPLPLSPFCNFFFVVVGLTPPPPPPCMWFCPPLTGPPVGAHLWHGQGPLPTGGEGREQHRPCVLFPFRWRGGTSGGLIRYPSPILQITTTTTSIVTMGGCGKSDAGKSFCSTILQYPFFPAAE